MIVEKIRDRIVTVGKVLKIGNTAAPGQLDTELVLPVCDVSNVLGGHFTSRYRDILENKACLARSDRRDLDRRYRIAGLALERAVTEREEIDLLTRLEEEFLGALFILVKIRDLALQM